MVKGNELDVGNSDFGLQAKISDNFVCFTLFELQRFVHISATRGSIEMGFGSKCDISSGQIIYIEKLN